MGARGHGDTWARRGWRRIWTIDFLAAGFTHLVSASRRRRFGPRSHSWIIGFEDRISNHSDCLAGRLAIADLMPSMTHWGPPDEEVYHQNALFRYSPLHRWYWYPNLRTNEILIWAGFDSDPRFPSIVPHAAFDNPACGDPNAYRTAVHGRAYVFYDA